MKAITVWTYWAHCIFAKRPDGSPLKGFETRGWETDYRGPLAIHAGMATAKQMQDFVGPEKYAELNTIGRDHGLPYIPELPRGVVLGTVELVDCFPIPVSGEPRPLIGRNIHGGPIYAELSEIERILGYFDFGRYAWRLDNPVAFPEPIPARGQQRLWSWEPPAFDWTCPACGTVNPSSNEHCPCELQYDRGMVSDDCR